MQGCLLRILDLQRFLTVALCFSTLCCAYASLAKIAGSAKLESEEFVYSTAIRTTVRSRRSPWHECSTCRNRGSCVATYCNSEECSGAACPSSSRCCLSCTTDTNKKS
eukprot:g3941.t1